MLDVFRKNKKGIFGLLIVGFLAAMMVPFGVDYAGKSDHNGESVGIKVAGKEITTNEYHYRLSQWQNAMRQQLGENFDKLSGMLNLQQRAIDELINGVILAKLTDSLGLGVSTVQMLEKLAAHPYFGGKITPAAYEDFLRAQGMTGVAYEEMASQQLLSEQLQSTLTDLSIPTDAELRTAFRDENTKASFRYAAFTAAAFESKVDTSDAEAIKSYFSDHAEEYRLKKAVSFMAVAFNPSEFAASVDVTEDDIKEYYESNPDAFAEPKQIKLRKMLFKIKEGSELEKMMGTAPKANADAAKNAARENAKKARERLEKGEEFADVAKQVSEDTTTAASGGDLGWVLYPTLEDRLRQSASRLDIGEYSNPLETKEGFVLLYVEDKKDSVQKPLEAVHAEIEQKLRASNSPEYAHAAAYEFLEELKNKRDRATPVSLLDFAGSKGKSVLQPEKPLSAGDTTAQIPAELSKQAASLNEGEQDVVHAGDVTYVVEVTKVQPSRIPDLEEVKDKVLEGYRKAHSVVLAKKAAEDALTQLRSTDASTKKTLADIAAASGTKIETTELAPKNTASGPLFMSPDAKRILFSLDKAHPLAEEVIAVGASFYLAELADRVAPEESEFESKKEELRKQEMADGGARQFDGLLKTLKSRYDVWVNPKLLEKSGSTW